MLKKIPRSSWVLSIYDLVIWSGRELKFIVNIPEQNNHKKNHPKIIIKQNYKNNIFVVC